MPSHFQDHESRHASTSHAETAVVFWQPRFSDKVTTTSNKQTIKKRNSVDSCFPCFQHQRNHPQKTNSHRSRSKNDQREQKQKHFIHSKKRTWKQPTCCCSNIEITTPLHSFIESSQIGKQLIHHKIEIHPSQKANKRNHQPHSDFPSIANAILVNSNRLNPTITITITTTTTTTITTMHLADILNGPNHDVITIHRTSSTSSSSALNEGFSWNDFPLIEQVPSSAKRSSSTSTTINNTKKTKTKKQVQFTNVQIREYNITAGYHDMCSDELAITLDWDYVSTSRMPIDEYEIKYRSSLERGTLHKMDYMERCSKLIDIAGWNEGDILAWKKLMSSTDHDHTNSALHRSKTVTHFPRNRAAVV